MPAIPRLRVFGDAQSIPRRSRSLSLVARVSESGSTCLTSSQGPLHGIDRQVLSPFGHSYPVSLIRTKIDVVCRIRHAQPLNKRFHKRHGAMATVAFVANHLATTSYEATFVLRPSY